MPATNNRRSVLRRRSEGAHNRANGWRIITAHGSHGACAPVRANAGYRSGRLYNTSIRDHSAAIRVRTGVRRVSPARGVGATPSLDGTGQVTTGGVKGPLRRPVAALDTP